jgi:hypothetical protein
MAAAASETCEGISADGSDDPGKVSNILRLRAIIESYKDTYELSDEDETFIKKNLSDEEICQELFGSTCGFWYCDWAREEDAVTCCHKVEHLGYLEEEEDMSPCHMLVRDLGSQSIECVLLSLTEEYAEEAGAIRAGQKHCCDFLFYHRFSTPAKMDAILKESIAKLEEAEHKIRVLPAAISYCKGSCSGCGDSYYHHDSLDHTFSHDSKGRYKGVEELMQDLSDAEESLDSLQERVDDEKQAIASILGWQS